MSIAFSCPDCGKNFKVPDGMAGRKAKCSGCGVMMQIGNAVGITARPSPKFRGAAVDETDDWQDEELPRKKRASQHLADEDDLEYEDDEPVRKRRKKKRKPAKKSGATVFVLLGIGLVALLGLAGVGGGLAWYFLSGPPDPLKFAPDNCKLVAVLNMDQIESSKAYETLNRDPMFFNKQIGGLWQGEVLKKAGVSQVLVAGAGTTFSGFGPAPIGGDNDKGVLVITTKNAVSAEELANDKSLKGPFTDSKVNGYTLYEGTPMSFCVVSKKQVLLGQTSALRTVLQRDKKPEFSDNLKAAIKQADLSKPIAVAVDTTGMANFGPNAKEVNLMELQWLAVQGNFGADINLNITVQSLSDKGAQEVKKQADELVKTIKNLQNMAGILGKKTPSFFDDPKMSTSGSTFTAEITIKTDALAEMIKNQANAVPPAGKPPVNNPPRGGNPGPKK